MKIKIQTPESDFRIISWCNKNIEPSDTGYFRTVSGITNKWSLGKKIYKFTNSDRSNFVILREVRFNNLEDSMMFSLAFTFDKYDSSFS